MPARARGSKRGRATFCVRRAREPDLPVLVLHRRKMWQDIEAGSRYAERTLDEADRAYRRWLRPRLRTGRVVAFLVQGPHGSPLGSGCVWLRETQPRPMWKWGDLPYIMTMFTEREARGRGVASAILREALRWAKAKGYPRIALHASTMGRRLYGELGFDRTWEMRHEFFALHPPRGRAPARRGQRR